MNGDYLPTRTTYDFKPETRTQARNRARLAAIMAQNKPAIEAPKGCFDLTEAGIKVSKPPKEIFEMMSKENGNGVAVLEAAPVMAEVPAAPAPPQERKQRRGHARQIPEELVRAMHARYMELGNLSKTAKEYGRNATYLAQQFKALGLPVKGVGDRRRGKGQKPTRAAKPAPRPSQPSNEAIRDIHADWTRRGGPLLDVAMSYRIDQNILRKRFRALGLDDTGVRMPYEPPSLATLPVSGNGKHAEVAREMVAEPAASVGAQTFLGGDTVSPPKPEETAVPIAPPKKPAPPPDYRIIHMLVEYLPADGRWTLHERELWLDATHAVLRLCVKEIRP